MDPTSRRGGKETKNTRVRCGVSWEKKNLYDTEKPPCGKMKKCVGLHCLGEGLEGGGGVKRGLKLGKKIKVISRHVIQLGEDRNQRERTDRKHYWHVDGSWGRTCSVKAVSPIGGKEEMGVHPVEGDKHPKMAKPSRRRPVETRNWNKSTREIKKKTHVQVLTYIPPP